MAFLNWKDDYSVKVGLFDDQHKHLFELINHFMSSHKKGLSDAAVEKAINGLAEYAVFHFHAEEELMSRHGYPHLEEHKVEHNRFAASVADFQKRLSEHGVQTFELSRFLMDWLVKHIMGHDRKYSDFFTSKGVN